MLLALFSAATFAGISPPRSWKAAYFFFAGFFVRKRSSLASSALIARSVIPGTPTSSRSQRAMVLAETSKASAARRQDYLVRLQQQGE